jgi:NADH:ubiquinone oxidoreductase subunit 2 (subunit N)
MDNILQHAHSGLRWIALLLLLITIIKAFSGMSGNKVFTAGDKKLALFTLITMHLQLVIGLSLYFIGKYYQAIDTTDESVKSLNRFFRMEHSLMMLIAIALITVGYSKAKRADSSKAKFKSLAIFFTIGLVIILAMIPWPFMQKFAGFKWF